MAVMISISSLTGLSDGSILIEITYNERKITKDERRKR